MIQANLLQFREIGYGWCGVVFENTDTTVLKLAKHDGNALVNDFLMQSRVHKEFAKVQDMFLQYDGLPRVTHPNFIVVPTNHEWWGENINSFPIKYQKSTHVLCLERIQPLLRVAREDLIDIFCPESGRKEAKEMLANEDCIARLYLGSRTRRSTGPQRFFSLRNFPLRLDIAENINLDIDLYVRQMAVGLAICHWRARVDANDIEWVLGGLGTDSYVSNDYFGKHVTQLWMLDYDKCRDLTMNNEGMKMAAISAEDNDPYYPKPHMSRKSDQELWEKFKTRYLVASDNILTKDNVQGEMLGFPARFIEEWDDYRKVKILKQAQ